REHDDMLGGFLDLANALEIADGRGNVFDTDAEQRRDGDAEQLGQPLERVDLGELAALKAIERRARDADLLRDLVGAEPRAHAVGFEPMPDLVVAKSHACPGKLPRPISAAQRSFLAPPSSGAQYARRPRRPLDEGSKQPWRLHEPRRLRQRDGFV